MGILDIFRTAPTSEPPVAADVRVEPQFTGRVRALTTEGSYFHGLDDPALMEMIRSGGGRATHSGLTVSTAAAMRNTTVLRCVSLISFAIGMLPLHMTDKATKAKADAHPLFRILHRRPNAWQTAFEFRSLMQQRALTDGDAFALIVRSGTRIVQLVPIEGSRVQVKQRPDWALEYHIDRDRQGRTVLPQREVFHVRNGMSLDGITGLAMVRQAAEAIALAIQTEAAAARLFRNGTTLGIIMKHPGRLSPEAFDRLQYSLQSREGVENAHRSMILEEGMDVSAPGGNGRDNQAIEHRKHQIEEIARPFGVPRPLLGMDDTSWGSGIDVLGQFFVRYALNPWFEAWQQAIERSLLTEAEAEVYDVKFNAGALLRGSMKDQADFFAKGLGAGGHTPWLHPDEPREWMDMPLRDDLPAAMGTRKGPTDEPA